MGLPSNGFLKVALRLIDKCHMSPVLRALASPPSTLSPASETGSSLL